MSRRRTFRKTVPDAAQQDPADEILRAKRKAMLLLTDMDRTEAELRRKLSGSFSAPAVEEAVRYVRSFGYIDDERYAAHYAETASARKSRTQIRFDLQKKGLSRELIDRALEGLETAADPLPDRKETAHRPHRRPASSGEGSGCLREKGLFRFRYPRRDQRV